MKQTKSLLFGLVMLSLSLSGMATNYYVSSLIGNNSNPGSLAQPFATMQTASDLTNPGDTVFVMNGTYSTVVAGVAVLRITRSGTESQPIVYKNMPAHTPLIQFNTWNGILIVDGAAYIVIDGFKIRGNNSNVTLSDALNQPTGCVNTAGSPSPLYNGNGINVEGRNAGGHCHHVTIRNNEVFECGGGGINALECDYITVENNLVYNTSWYTRYGSSGISFLHSWNFDNNTSINKMIIRNNIVYGNQLFVPWRNGTVCQGITDGNGIIYDDNRSTQLTGGIPYTGKALIENNISYRNGGRGVHSYLSDNVTIRNNTTFQNCKSAEIPDGEVTVITGDNVKVYNNIMYARAGKRVSSASNVTNYLQDNNIMFNSPLRGAYSTNDILIDPKFVDTANNNFTLAANSPAINAGSNIAGAFSSTDILGVTRPVGTLPDMGAYEFTGLPSAGGNFAINNIAVVRVGDGSSVLGTNAAMVNILEYTTAGVPTGVNVVLSDAISTAPNRIVLSGDNATGEGQLHLSSDGRYISLAGYEGAVGDASTVYQANEKVIARIAYNALADFSTRIPGTTINRTVRSAVTENSNRYYIAGSSVSPASGNSTRFLSFGTPATTASIAFNGAVRSLKIFKAQVYSANSNVVSSLTPNPSSGNFATKVDFPGVNVPGHNYQSFVLLDIDASASYVGTGFDVLYCADQNLGLVKFYWNGSTWIFAGSFNPSSATGVTGGLHDITAKPNSSGNAEIYAVKGAVSNNNIVTITDASGLTGNITTIVPSAANVISAGVNYMFRGVAFTPSQVVTLPIQLLSFKAYLVGNKVSLNWTTSQELNAKEFVVERSSNAIDFYAIGVVAATNRGQGNNYAFEDIQPVKGINYYRLKSTDKDGSFKYSSVAVIKFNNIQTLHLSIFPNPVVDQLTISHPKAIDGAMIRIIDVNGKTIARYNVVKDATQTSVNASPLIAGQYFINYYSDGKSFSKSFIK